MKRSRNYFTRLELALWSVSVALITLSYLIFDRGSHVTLVASLVGVTALIFCAKGNPAGQLLMVIFGIIYGGISFFCAYYGEMFTYVGMTVPMAVISLISWLRNPFRGNRAEVKVNALSLREGWLIAGLTAVVTLAFYGILKYFNTANLLVSTLSVATSFVAVYFSFRRSPYFALAYAVNDLVLIVLWVLASMSELRYISVSVCFVAFLFNDLYSFANWQRMKKRQARATA